MSARTKKKSKKTPIRTAARDDGTGVRAPSLPMCHADDVRPDDFEDLVVGTSGSHTPPADRRAEEPFGETPAR